MRLFKISLFVTEMVLSEMEVFCQYTQPSSNVPASSHGDLERKGLWQPHVRGWDYKVNECNFVVLEITMGVTNIIST